MSANALNLLLPADMSVWNELRRMLADKSFRVEDAAACASQDPVVVIDFLRVANATAFAGDRQTTSAVQTAIQRLGSKVVLEALDKIKDRPQLPNEDVLFWFEVHRSRCKRTGNVGRIISSVVAPQLAEEAQAASLLLNIGDMVAVAFFKDHYVRLAEEHSRSGINYKLSLDHKFNVDNVGVSYLKRNGMPELLLTAITRDGTFRQADKAVLRPICLSASELVEAFDNDRWLKFSPGKKLAPKSPIRLLSISDPQYSKLYERISEYLFQTRELEDKKKLISAGIASSTMLYTPGGSERDEEIQTLARSSERPELVPPPAPRGPPATPPAELKEVFSIGRPPPAKNVPRAAPPVPKVIPTLRTNRANDFVRDVDDLFKSATSSEALLTEVLGMLVDNGPFKQAALIVVSKDRSQAIVVASRGSKMGSGQRLALDDISPLGQCLSRIQSFGIKESEHSPFGSKAFALAPIAADHDTPVALYADCAEEIITFEARRIFRTVVDILNERLPSIPGGIPVELDS